jgi:hypothetical protein
MRYGAAKSKQNLWAMSSTNADEPSEKSLNKKKEFLPLIASPYLKKTINNLFSSTNEAFTS